MLATANQHQAQSVESDGTQRQVHDVYTVCTVVCQKAATPNSEKSSQQP